MADGSQMAPDIRVHDGFQTQLLSFAHCQELAIIPPVFPKPVLEVTYANGEDSGVPPPPMRIHLKADAVPFVIYMPKPIPFAFRGQVREELDSMVQQGIITPVGEEPSEWCHPIVLLAKNKGVRITVDLDKTQLSGIAPHSVFPPAVCGGPQRHPLDELLHDGGRPPRLLVDRPRRRGPAPDRVHHPERAEQALPGTDGLCSHRRCLLPPGRRGSASVSFCGYRLSADGISSDDDKVRAIRDFPTPANLTDLRSFMGLLNQLAYFTQAITSAAQPLRPLLSLKHSFTWTPDHDKAFADVERGLSLPTVLAPFDPALPVVLQTDASRLYGIGYPPLQDHVQGHLRLVQCCSRFLTDAENRYAHD
ncbi:uncharacterized protein LOC143028884 [Oratosquilla oratoria]|uniref:uncharacterized protein LOC143028884 n=1 Tax=Oratosquilla oratoria TaxID=337810 RepID=UPI003F769013